MGKSFWKELLILLWFTFLGLIITGILSFIVVAVLSVTSLGVDSLTLHVAQWLQTIFVMFLPPIWWYWRRKNKNALKDFGFCSFNWKYAIYAVIYVVISEPATELVEVIFHNIPWPEAIKESLQQSALENYNVMGMLLSGDSIFAWVEQILLVSICTGIAEETMFRGGLLKCFDSSTLNKHKVAVAIGFIFAAIHFEPEGFVVRWFLGSLFCYFVYWSGSIWPAIIAHAANNLLALIQYKIYGYGNPLAEDTYELTFGWVVSIISVVATIAFIYYIQKHAASLPEPVEEEPETVEPKSE